MATLPLPAGLATVEAPAAWRVIDFVSDLHLAEDGPNSVAAWERYLCATTADAVFILGDLFEFWLGDDSRHAGFEARCAAALTEATTRRPLAFMCGNRDFLLGREMLEACGVAALTDPTVLVAFGERVLLTHGDALCLDDADYQRFRKQVRNAEAQRQFLAHPLPERRVLVRSLRELSEGRKTEQSSDAWSDVNVPSAIDWLHAADATQLIHGHTHRPGTQALGSGLTRHVLSDWDLDHGTAPRAEVLRWQAGGMTRLRPEHAVTPTG